MRRRTFLLAAGAAALAGGLPTSSALAAGVAASDAIASAERYLGIPYIYGGNDPARGLDCSSYVSLIWRIPRQSTDTIHNYSFEIGKDDLMPGDVMNRPFAGRASHCRVFVGWATEDRSVAWMYECAFRRGVNTRPIAYDDRYTPIRRYDFVADLPLPEPKLPVDYEVPYGRFFSQAGSKDGLSGFQVVDKDGIPLFSEFRRLGGVEALGYPVSRRFDLSAGQAAQWFQRGFLRWSPDERRADRLFGLEAPIEARAPERSPLMNGPVDWRPPSPSWLA
ncbi:MAG TPA: hypothetical protein VGL23_20515 [Chloroflexota bacterium]